MQREMTGRRRFFRLLGREGAVLFDEARGRPQRRLAELPELPAAELGRLIPAVCEGVAIRVENGQVCAQLPGAATARALFPVEPACVFIFNHFDGRTPIESVGRELSASMGWTAERGFREVRAMFLRLVNQRVCAPVNVADTGKQEGQR
jgi:hypothetical protein